DNYIKDELVEDADPAGRNLGHRNAPQGNRPTDTYWGHDGSRLTNCKYFTADSPGFHMLNNPIVLMRRENPPVVEAVFDVQVRILILVIDVCKNPPGIASMDVLDIDCRKTFLNP